MTKAASRSNLLKEFLGEMVLIFLKDMNTQISTDEGVADVPLMVEGILRDYDDSFLLISDENEVTFSLVSMSCVGKIDMADNVADSMKDPNRPKPSEMN